MNVDGLVEKIDNVLGPIIRADAPCALLDFPNHSNVGDSAIWLGQLDHFKRMGGSINYSCDSLSYNPDFLNLYCFGNKIFFAGGGSFGDLWHHHQIMRESVLSKFKEQPVVQLPQSIYYQSQKNIESTQRAVAAHSAFTLLVRDMISHDFAKKYFECKVHLCPDMAFAIKKSRLKQYAPNDGIKCVYLCRTDIEAKNEKSDKLPEEVLKLDWVDEQIPASAKYHRLMDRFERRAWARRTLPVQTVRLRLSEALAQTRLERGCRILCQSERVVTDRLHAMILSALLNRKVYAFDNSYGKLSSFYETWEKFLPGIMFFNNEEEAISAALS